LPYQLEHTGNPAGLVVAGEESGAVTGLPGEHPHYNLINR
jgi:hypothetical protein